MVKAKTNLNFNINKELSSSNINLANCATHLGSIEYVNTAQTIDQAYPTIASQGAQVYTLQTTKGIYTLRIVGNFVSDRLYYHIIDQLNEYVIRFAPLSPWPFNLLTNEEFEGYYLFFQFGNLYFGELKDYEVKIEESLKVKEENLWIDYIKLAESVRG